MVGRLLLRLLRRRAEVAVLAAPDEALLAAAHALRRLGVRIVRYDADGGRLEAQPPGAAAPIRLSASPESSTVTRLAIEGGAGVRRLLRRVRAELGRRA